MQGISTHGRMKRNYKQVKLEYSTNDRLHNKQASLGSSAFFEQKSRASTVQSEIAIETTIKILGRKSMPLNIATNISFEDENEGDAVDSKADDNGPANAVEAKVINDHTKQEATDDVALPPTAKYS
ncbi:hypothetical protein MAM1_0259c08848 [Mucor ambiguus]|uniref:Uncharacterized protein n=1 Tax=Mucor ambiguus TaxID=91626 RepID=A0A0C9N425_9FUNG|nr:hypothetical protein MAM1_0259c08848 [Mucor ambiguus]